MFNSLFWIIYGALSPSLSKPESRTRTAHVAIVDNSNGQPERMDDSIGCSQK